MRGLRLLAAVLTMPAVASAADPAPIGFPGVRAPYLAAEDRAAIDVEIVNALERHAPVRTAAELEQALKLTRENGIARKNADEAEMMLAALEIEGARVAFASAIGVLDAAGADAIDPDRMVALLEKYARVVYALERPNDVKAAVERMARLAPARELDPKEFPPDVLALHAAARDGWITEVPNRSRLMAGAKSGRVRWLATARARTTEGGVELNLVVAQDDSAVAATRNLRVASRADLPRALGTAFGEMFAELGKPVSLVQTKVPRDARAPVDSNPKPLPFYRRWYVLAAVVAVLASGAAVTAAAANRDGAGGPEPTPTPEEGSVLIVFPDP